MSTILHIVHVVLGFYGGWCFGWWLSRWMKRDEFTEEATNERISALCYAGHLTPAEVAEIVCRSPRFPWSRR